MTREQLEHVIRAAASIASDDDIIVVGSQAILGPHPDATGVLVASMEAYVFPRNHPERWDLVDGSIGEGSPFHATFGYYAQGVGPETATLPRGWEQRLVPVRSPRTAGATGWCLEAHDLLLSKCAAGRDKDFAFLDAAARAGFVKRDVLLERVDTMKLDPEVATRVRGRITRTFAP